MKKILNSKETDLILEPHYTKIVDAISKSFADYLQVSDLFNNNGRNVVFKKATIASMVHDFTKERIKKAFADIEDLETKDYNKIFGFHLKGKVLIRFKKINKDFTTSNIQTKQTINYSKQIEIEGMPESPTYLYAGYMPNETWTGIKNIYIICKQEKNLLWQKDLTGITEQTSIKFIPDKEGEEQTIIGRVKVKIKEKKISKTGS